MNFLAVAHRQQLPVLKGPTFNALPKGYSDLLSRRASPLVTENFAELAVFPTREALKKLKDRPANWDGFNSDAPSPEAIGTAFQLIDSMYQQSTKCAAASWVNPHVSSSETGEVVFEWWKNDRKLTIYVSPQGAEFLRVSGPNIDHDMQDGPLVGSQFAGLWLWLNV